MTVRYLKAGDVPVPTSLTRTEITTYLWPGFLGEFDREELLFTAWELVTPTEWRLRPDIVTPPFDCLAVDKAVPTLKWALGGDLWALQGSVVRQLQAPMPQAPMPQAQMLQ